MKICLTCLNNNAYEPHTKASTTPNGFQGHWSNLFSTHPSRSDGHRHVHHFLNCHLHLSPLCNTRWLKYPWYLRTNLCDFNFILRIQFYFCAPCVSSGGAGRKRENILLYGKYLKIMVFDYLENGQKVCF